MRCSNCGKVIPFAGRVCPWCKQHKGKDQAMMLGLMPGFALGIVISATVFESIVAGIVFSMCLGIVTASIATLAYEKLSGDKSDPELPDGL